MPPGLTTPARLESKPFCAPTQASTWPYSVTDDCAWAAALIAPDAVATASATARLVFHCMFTSSVDGVLAAWPRRMCRCGRGPAGQALCRAVRVCTAPAACCAN